MLSLFVRWILSAVSCSFDLDREWCRVLQEPEWVVRLFSGIYFRRSSSNLSEEDTSVQISHRNPVANVKESFVMYLQSVQSALCTNASVPYSHTRPHVKSRIAIVALATHWFCCMCGDGPMHLALYSKCTSCGHMRCTSCRVT